MFLMHQILEPPPILLCQQSCEPDLRWRNSRTAERGLQEPGSCRFDCWACSATAQPDLLGERSLHPCAVGPPFCCSQEAGRMQRRWRAGSCVVREGAEDPHCLDGWRAQLWQTKEKRRKILIDWFLIVSVPSFSCLKNRVCWDLISISFTSVSPEKKNMPCYETCHWQFFSGKAPLQFWKTLNAAKGMRTPSRKGGFMWRKRKAGDEQIKC